MKILLIADHEEEKLWDNWTEATAKRLSDISLILSAGDLHPSYLEFLVTMLNVPLVYVRGNHDGYYDEEPPEGCDDADGNIVEVTIGSGESRQKIRILGFGGSMRYNDDAGDMYTEKEMRARIRKVKRFRRLRFDILLTHAPCRGYGDMEDIPHRGFECFNDLLNKYSPQLHCYGHIHKQYGGLERQIQHPSGTLLINGSGYQIIDFAMP